MRFVKGCARIGIVILGLCALPAQGEKPELAMLDRLDTGLWELRARGSGAPGQRLCIHNGRELIQLRHPGIACKQVVVADTPSEVTVQYMCAGKGYGRTHIRRETDNLVQIDSQGIREGQPFSFASEGRRVGPCTG